MEYREPLTVSSEGNWTAKNSLISEKDSFGLDIEKICHFYTGEDSSTF